MDDRIRELVAVGASITANCQPCLQAHVEKARLFGAAPEEVAMVIEIGNRIRSGAAARMDTFSSNLQAAGAPVSAEVVLTANGRDFLGP